MLRSTPDNICEPSYHVACAASFLSICTAAGILAEGIKKENGITGDEILKAAVFLKHPEGSYS